MSVGVCTHVPLITESKTNVGNTTSSAQQIVSIVEIAVGAVLYSIVIVPQQNPLPEIVV
jgi:hypothetical protein